MSSANIQNGLEIEKSFKKIVAGLFLLSFTKINLKAEPVTLVENF